MEDGEAAGLVIGWGGGIGTQSVQDGSLRSHINVFFKLFRIQMQFCFLVFSSVVQSSNLLS